MFKFLANLGKISNGKIWKTVIAFIFDHIHIEHFIVWMRTAGLPNFRKLWGKIDAGLTAGTYQLSISNTYDVQSFEGKKTFVLSTTNALGGKNYFLAICYIVVGALCLIFAIIFLVAFIKKRSSSRND
jgi:hypothetical protein